jgi:quinolinate synthase
MLADEVCSTEKMVTFCKESPARDIIIVTEAGMLHRLRREIPGKNFIPGPTEHCACAECRFMKMNTLEKAFNALRDLEPEIISRDRIPPSAFTCKAPPRKADTSYASQS